MEEVGYFFLQCCWYLLPMGFANTAPVLVKGWFKRLAIPVDRFLGQHGVFGPHKTIRGILAAVVVGFFAFWWQRAVSVAPWAHDLGFFEYKSMSLWFGFFAGFGAILGDLLRSAVKRRMGVRPGGKFIPFDQLDYVFGGILFTLPFFQPTVRIVFATLLVGFILHVITSTVGFGLGMKKDRF